MRDAETVQGHVALEDRLADPRPVVVPARTGTMTAFEAESIRNRPGEHAREPGWNVEVVERNHAARIG